LSDQKNVIKLAPLPYDCTGKSEQILVYICKAAEKQRISHVSSRRNIKTDTCLGESKVF